MAPERLSIWFSVVVALVGVVPTSVSAAECNRRIDAVSNPLLKGRLDEALLHLSAHGVKELQEWECRTLSCPKTSPRIIHFDRQGRVVETDNSGVLTRYDYKGKERYPSHETSIATTGSFRSKGTVLGESSDTYTPEGLRVGDAAWASNETVAAWTEVATGQSQMYLRGRLFSAKEVSLGFGGFPRDVMLEKDCKTRNEDDGVTYVATYLKTSDAPQRLVNEARFNAKGDWVWNRSYPPSGEAIEQVFTVLGSDRRGNWTVRKNQSSRDTSYVQFREITYWD